MVACEKMRGKKAFGTGSKLLPEDITEKQIDDESLVRDVGMFPLGNCIPLGFVP